MEFNNIRMETEESRLQLELMQAFMPKEAITNYYRYGQASVIAIMIEWVVKLRSVTENNTDSLTAVSIVDAIDECLLEFLNSNKELEEMTKRLLKDYDIDLNKYRKSVKDEK